MTTQMTILPSSTNEFILDNQGVPLSIPTLSIPTHQATYTQEQTQADFDKFQDECDLTTQHAPQMRLLPSSTNEFVLDNQGVPLNIPTL